MVCRFTREYLIDCLHRLEDRLGRTPKEADTHQHADIPGHTTYVKRFGTWRAALEGAGIPIDPSNMRYDREMLLELLRKTADQLGRVPAASEMDELPGPHSSSFRKYFGSWRAALSAIGLRPTSLYLYETEELLTVLRELAAELGHAPSTSELKAPPDLPADTTYRRRFGTWHEAITAAGLTPSHKTPNKGSAK